MRKRLRDAGRLPSRRRIDVMNIGLPDVLMLLFSWVIPAAVVLFFLYWTIRLAIRHELRRTDARRP
ncbi:hypothetical protein [Nonomuraea salmonea]